MQVSKKDSAQSGVQLRGTSLPVATWEKHNQGYTQNWDDPKYKLAREYLAEKAFCPDSEFDHGLDCLYLDNFCHVEERGGHRFLRPSNCTKFVFRRSRSVFNDPTYAYSYHGTNSANVRSILTYGLRPGGSAVDGRTIPMTNGACLGTGVYTSTIPLYAQLYAPVEHWRNYYVQTLFMVRQSGGNLEHYADEGCATQSLIGRNDIWRLYGGLFRANQTQMKTQRHDGIVIQALLVKIHDVHPMNNQGEYYKICDLLRELDGKQ
jgi:hypothetical protein